MFRWLKNKWWGYKTRKALASPYCYAHNVPARGSSSDDYNPAMHAVHIPDSHYSSDTSPSVDCGSFDCGSSGDCGSGGGCD